MKEINFEEILIFLLLDIVWNFRQTDIMNNPLEDDGGDQLMGLNTSLNDNLNELVERVEMESKTEQENTQSLMVNTKRNY